jgi:hypothetical protein
MERCKDTGLAIAECGCSPCLHRRFDLYYARREAARGEQGMPSPEVLGRQQARRELAEARASHRPVARAQS